MNLQTKMPTTAEEFLCWEGGREDRKYEFVDGEILERPRGETRAHARLVSQLLFLFASHFNNDKFDIAVGGFSVLTSRDVRRPDIVFDPRTPETRGTDLSAREPVLISEIMSPALGDRDLTEKAAEYLALPRLACYAVFAQDEPRLWLWSRWIGRGWGKATEIAGLNEKVALGQLDMMVNLAELYGECV